MSAPSRASGSARQRAASETHPAGGGRSRAAVACGVLASTRTLGHFGLAHPRVVAAAALLVLLAAASGCKRSAQTAPPPTASASQQEQQFIPAPAQPPAYSFAPGVRESQREIAGFVQQFLEVCLAGDYSGYRRLASSSREPETKERFQAIYHAMRNVVVEEIEEVELREVPGPAYRVVASVELDPQARVALRGSQRQIALLIVQEGGDWRMLPAPAALQPPKAGEETTPEEPQEPPAPDYPWEEDGDY